MTARAASLVALGAMAVACGSPSQSAPAPTYRTLGGEVARTGDTAIGVSLVRSTAQARGVPARRALDALVDDALAAEGARSRGMDRAPDVAWSVSSTLARAVASRVADDARVAGAPRDDELATVSVVHAVVLRSRSVDEAKARNVAGAIRDAVAGAPSPNEFLARAQAVAAAREVRVVAEQLPPFDVSGRAETGMLLEPDFVAAAFDLRVPGETGPVVETPFGWHVIRLVDRIPAPAEDLTARRQELAAAVLDVRARGRLASLLRSRREHTSIERSAAADELMARASARP